MLDIKNKFLLQLQTISKMEMIKTFTPFLYGEDALLLKLYLKETNSPTIIASELGITKGRVTAIINSLKQKGFIHIEQNLLDRRKVELQLSNTGEAYILSKIHLIDDYFERLLRFVGKDESKTLVDLLEKLLAKVKQFEVMN